MSALLAEKPPLVTQTTVISASDNGAGETVWQALRGLWSNRHLTGLMVYRDFVGRYKGSLLGALWPLVNPLGHMILYTFVFSMVLKVRFGDDPSTSSFALYLMAGLLPWSALAEAVSRASKLILESPNLVKRVVFPLEVLPFTLAVSALLSEVVAFALLLGAIVLFTGHLHLTIVFLPLVVLSQFMFIAGVSWMLASMGVFVRDLPHLIALGLSAWMYATPIVYPATSMPKNFQWLLWINPMAGIVGDYRRVLLQGLAPDWISYAGYTAAAVCLWICGFYFFHKTKRSFADVM